jgi:hypothetical protein
MLKFTKRTLTIAALVAAVGAPSTAYAMYAEDPPLATGSVTSLTHGQQAQLEAYQRAVAKRFSAGPGGLAGPTVRVQNSGASSSPGFQWDDAGIGAAAMLGLLGAGMGAGAVTRSRQRHNVIGG